MPETRRLVLGVALITLGCEQATPPVDSSIPSDAHTPLQDARDAATPSPDVGVEAQPIAAYDFTAGDTTEPRAGVRWASNPEPSERGLMMTYRTDPPDDDGGGPELRYAYPETSDLYQRVQIRLPMNFSHRREIRLEVGSAAGLASWRVGDVVVGADGVSRGTVSFVVGVHAYLSFADNQLLDSAWLGTVRNQTRSESVVVVGHEIDGQNNKLWSIWMDDYSQHGAGPTVVWELWPNEANRGGSVLAVHWSTGNHTGGNSHRMHTPFFRVPEDRGRLIDVVTHVRAASARGANDGVVQLWRRGEGDARYVLVHDVHDADIAPGLPEETEIRQWAHGYLFGWANSGYAEDTTFHITRFEHWGAVRPPELDR